MHWPSSTDPNDLNKHLPDWDYVKTWAEMQKLVGTGEVKNIGVSNFGITHLERLLNNLSCKMRSKSLDNYACKKVTKEENAHS